MVEVMTLIWTAVNAIIVIILCKVMTIRYRKLYVALLHIATAIILLGAQQIYARSHPPGLGVILGIFTMLVANVIILQIIVANSKKEAAQAKLTELLRLRELEQAHYSAVELRRHELTKIRHDFNSQLTAAHHLIAAEKNEHARKLLDELKQHIGRTKERQYCQHVIVNAVLAEKQKACDVADITLDTEIAIDENCEIASIHLCSIFSNLLDNAIHACAAVKEGQRAIALHTFIKGGYMHIKCVNPVAAMPEKRHGAKGYGKVILSDIANHYHGNFTARIVDGKHVAVVSVLHRSVLSH